MSCLIPIYIRTDYMVVSSHKAVSTQKTPRNWSNLTSHLQHTSCFHPSVTFQHIALLSSLCIRAGNGCYSNRILGTTSHAICWR